jgi:cellulose synthase operon protein C
MKLFVAFRLVLVLAILAAISSGCSRDPNVRKQKYLQSGQRYFQEGKYDEAAIEFTNAIQIDPGFAEAHYGLAQSHLKEQQWSRAYQELARTVELQPENRQARIDMINLLIAGRDFQQAEEQMGLLLQKWPNDPQVHTTLSSLLAAKGHFSGAIEEMQKAVSLGPGRWEAYLNLALLQAKNNQAEAAEANFKKAIELNPKDTDAQLFLGTFYQGSGRFAEAEQRFRNAIALNPRNPELCGFLARLYLAEGKKAKAEEYVSHAKLDFPDNSAGYRMLGDFYSAIGDLDKALTEYSSLYRQHSHDFQVKKNYTELLIVENRIAEARKLDDEILNANPRDNDGLVYRGQIQIRDGQVNDAITTLQAVVKNDLGNAAGHYHLGIALEKAGNLQGAESEWREAVRIRPDMVEAQRALAGVGMRKGDMSALEEAASQMISLQPTWPDGYALRALAHIKRQQLAEAENDAQKAIAVAPRSPVGYVQMGNLRFVQKRFGEAEKAYESALSRDADSEDALRGLMNTFVVQNLVDKAIAAANAQIAQAPNNGAFYDLLGTALFRNKKDLDGAEAAFEKSVALDRNNLDALIKLGEVQAAKGETDQAIAIYEKYLGDHLRQASLYILLGQLYESKRDWKKAEGAYENALAFKPEDPVASNNLANVIVQNGGNFDVALSLAQTARRGLPDSPDVADTLGWIYYQKGAYKLSISLLDEALRLLEKNKMPDNADIHYHLGLAYEKSDQPQLARQQFERVLKINPNYDGAADVKKQLAQLKS